MKKDRIREALKILEEEINSEELDTNMTVYKIYCAMNSFFANWAKKNLLDRESAEKNNEIKLVLLDFINALVGCMKKYSEAVRNEEERSLK